MDKTFIFDLDDTLICNHNYYSYVKLEFAHWAIDRIGLKAPDAQYIINLQTKISKNYPNK